MYKPLEKEMCSVEISVLRRNKPQNFISDKCKEHSLGKARILNTFVCVL
jgi:hypothetical protein